MDDRSYSFLAWREGAEPEDIMLIVMRKGNKPYYFRNEFTRVETILKAYVSCEWHSCKRLLEMKPVAAPGRQLQPGHFQVTKVVRQVIMCERQRSKGAKSIPLGKYSSEVTRSTQPCIPPGSLNRVPALAGVEAGMSPLPGGR